MTFEEFERRVEPAARDLEDRLLRYVSSPQEHDLAGPTRTPFIFMAFLRIGAVLRLDGKEVLSRRLTGEGS
jgi:hypothetical protein